MKKKISILCLILGIVLLVPGCGKKEDEKPKEQTLVCKSTDTEEGMSVEQVISMTYKDNKLNHMTMEVNTKVTDADVQKNWSIFKASMDEQNKEINEEGLTLKAEANDENYEYKITLDIDVLKASEESLKEQGFEGLKEDTSTIEESKKTAEEDGSVCEIK